MPLCYRCRAEAVVNGDRHALALSRTYDARSCDYCGRSMMPDLREADAVTDGGRTSDLTPGDHLTCDESRAENPRHDFGADYSGLGPRFVRFHALVDSVQGDYVEATITRTNPHLRAPDRGAHLALLTTTIADESRWEVES